MNKLFLFACMFFFLNTASSQKKYEIVLPNDYDKTNIYPLFIVFHGGNGNIKNMRTWWVSNKLSNEFIVVYFEATTLDNPPNYWGWRNLSIERNNIKQYYSEIIEKYRIKDDQVYAGGFSLGGKVSVDLALNQIIPIKGLISLNHGGGTTEFFTSENIIKARNKDFKAVLISGTHDYRYQKETLKIKKEFETYKLKHQFVQIKNLGHAVPDNFSILLDDYLGFIMD
ncbi:hypothetical protein [Jejuia spongiicola]|uniref:Phospholipase/carboxylesterase/thioesterase domain-containing protein n=1 Tax=Jejuia spongiicola TaxID=2942207 RepID=A0ABT0QF11_9FLAO|nr:MULTISPECIES: hypothetical protein [Flavobacteriaceae]MCL6294829.1 hypothetical protein [Jejuia spongiicola]